MTAALFVFLSFLAVFSAELIELPGTRTATKYTSNYVYQVSLVTVTNSANAPFYYHTALEMAIFDPLTNKAVDRHSYGLYPSLSKNNGGLILGLFYRLWRFVRPIWSCRPRVRSPDLLLEGMAPKIPAGQQIYREDYTLTRELYQALEQTVFEWDGPYSYLGWWGTDNCSSWVRRLLNEYVPLLGGTEKENNICCHRYYFHLPEIMGGKVLRLPILPLDFPKFCHSESRTSEHFAQVYCKTAVSCANGGTAMR